MAKYQSDYTGAQIEALLDKVNNNNTLLWTNSAPSTGFAAQTVSVDLTDYSWVKIVFMLRTEYQRMIVVECPKGSGIANAIVDYNPLWYSARSFSSSDSGVEFATAYKDVSGTTTSDNTNLIPYKIYGII